MSDLSGNIQEDVVLIVEGNLTIERAGELKGTLLKALKDAASIVICFKDDSRIDVSFLQLLCAAHRSACSSGKHLKLVQTIPDTLLKEVRNGGYAHHPVWDCNSNSASVKSQGGRNE
jgi:anti-anti-sigma regulatory factor